jgi:hypothetical protein
MLSSIRPNQSLASQVVELQRPYRLISVNIAWYRFGNEEFFSVIPQPFPQSI